jgi:thiamine biosynthesis lipoprotein ApbE
MAVTAQPMRTAAAEWKAIGCAIRLVVTEPDDLPAARRIVASEIDLIDRACSRFRADSELSRMTAAGGRPVRISQVLAEAVTAALDAAAATDGDVDPALGAELVAAGYDQDFAELDRDTDRRPLEVDRDVIRVVRRQAAWRHVELDDAAMTLRLPAGVVLDLGATAKALAADRTARRLTAELDGRGVLVSLGGDIAVGGESPAAGWSVRVQDVTGPVGSMPTGPSQVIALTGGGLATSSTAARRWVRGGQLMHHILDPRTGVPVASDWRTVTVAAPTCLEANVASTAAIVRGVAALGWFASRGLAARLVDTADTVTTVGGWPAATVRSR